MTKYPQVASLKSMQSDHRLIPHLAAVYVELGSRMEGMVRIAAFVAALMTAHAVAAPGATKLRCGLISGFTTEAEMKAVPSQGIHAVDLTFIGAKPRNKDVDRLLRECAAAAIGIDPSKDILVSAWFRKRPGDSWRDDDLLHPYGSMKYLSYQASSKTVAVRELKLQKK